VLFLLALHLFAKPALNLQPLAAACAAALCLALAWLAASAASFFAGADPAELPEAAGLARASRVSAWSLVAAAVALAFAWLGWGGAIRALHLGVGLVLAVAAIELAVSRIEVEPGGPRFPVDLAVLSALGSRADPLSSSLDAAQRQLGIDLRSTWALTVVRRSAAPLAVGLVAAGWLSSSLTVVGVDEQGLAERLGVPLGTTPLEPGIHLHWPWPIEDVYRVPVRRVQQLNIGHEGEEEHGPENVLWARQHAASEYTLLLGNGRDLIAIDAAVQFRIRDPFAWRYRSASPLDALRAIAYRAVMKSTVNRTLTETLSENVAVLTAQMRTMVQADADSLGLGIEVTAFTIGGMHPPVMVAADYQAVVSAELGKTTAAVDAQAYRNETLPAAESEVLRAESEARAESVDALARATGEAVGFRGLSAAFSAAPDEFRFRRRLETLEATLYGRRFTVIDERIQRDGGELWLLN
jgi:membrane protease subunit HflK